MSGVSLAVAPRPDCDQKTPHDRRQDQTAVEDVMESLRVIDLQLVAFITVFSASGFVPLFDLLFPAFTSAYLLLLSQLVFPEHGCATTFKERLFQSSRLFTIYVIMGLAVGLFLPLAYVLGGFARGDDHAVNAQKMWAGIQSVTEGEAHPSSATDLGFANPKIQTSTLPSPISVLLHLPSEWWLAEDGLFNLDDEARAEKQQCAVAASNILRNFSFMPENELITEELDDTVVLDGVGDKKSIEERCEQISTIIQNALRFSPTYENAAPVVSVVSKSEKRVFSPLSHHLYTVE
ncbi:hypothetical protein L2E82_42189 [Cichorium intybus]|uniref:Uncharacterized protein n=1 Tax=Cichorium intybus TaxID=13427 RepID=A0ACB8ZL69_CICIN|nr:hypothetical protein L2E82_42189 [Cichorium intybus]